MVREGTLNMFGMDITSGDVAATLLALGVTIFFLATSNPHEAGSRDAESLRLARIGLCFALWSYGFGLFGMLLAFAGFILGLVAVIKGRAGYGIAVIIASVALPILGMMKLI